MLDSRPTHPRCQVAQWSRDCHYELTHITSYHSKYGEIDIYKVL